MTQKSTAGSRQVDKALGSVTIQTSITLDSISLILDFFNQKIENLPNLPVEFEAENDPDCVQYFV